MIYVWHGPDSGEVDSKGWTHTIAEILLDGSSWQLEVVHTDDDYTWSMDRTSPDSLGFDDYVHEWASFDTLIDEMMGPYWEQQ